MYQGMTGGTAAVQRTGAEPGAQMTQQNWAGELRPQWQEPTAPGYSVGTLPGMIPGAMPGYQIGMTAPARGSDLQFETGLSQDAIESPMNAQEAYQGSLKALLAKNTGHYVVATFLIGTQSPVSWEGFLHSVGNDYLVIFQPDQGRYITGDFYALKFVEFHDTKGVVPPCAGYRRRDGQNMW